MSTVLRSETAREKEASCNNTLLNVLLRNMKTICVAATATAAAAADDERQFDGLSSSSSSFAFCTHSCAFSEGISELCI